MDPAMPQSSEERLRRVFSNSNTHLDYEFAQAVEDQKRLREQWELRDSLLIQSLRERILEERRHCLREVEHVQQLLKTREFELEALRRDNACLRDQVNASTKHDRTPTKSPKAWPDTVDEGKSVPLTSFNDLKEAYKTQTGRLEQRCRAFEEALKILKDERPVYKSRIEHWQRQAIVLKEGITEKFGLEVLAELLPRSVNAEHTELGDDGSLNFRLSAPAIAHSKPWPSEGKRNGTEDTHNYPPESQIHSGFIPLQHPIETTKDEGQLGKNDLPGLGVGQEHLENVSNQYTTDNNDHNRTNGSSTSVSFTDSNQAFPRISEQGKPTLVKDEPKSDSTGLDWLFSLKRTQTYDLDHVGDKIVTPRKRARFGYASDEESEVDEHQSFPNVAVPSSPPNSPMNRTRKIFLDEDVENVDPQVRPVMQVGTLKQEPLYPGRAEVGTTTTDRGITDRPQFGRALRPIDSNQRLACESNLRKAPKLQHELLRQVATIAEDGEPLSQPNNATAKHLHKSPFGEITSNRLLSLLDGSTPVRKQLHITPRTNPPKSHAPRSNPRPINPALKRKTASVQTTLNMSKHISTSTHDPSMNTMKTTTLPPLLPVAKKPFPITSPAPPKTRLRDKRQEQLTLEDFKPNPAHNQGLDYAFLEHAPRGRQERSCARGCIDPHCCGPAMRVIAETIDFPNLRSTLAVDPEDIELSDDELLIKRFLGHAWDRERVRLMPAPDREEVLLKAKMKMASMYGKHKVMGVAKRRASPPGFWRVDMPSTQEMERDWEEADRAVRERVKERWEEAKKGGAWLFRDE